MFHCNDITITVAFLQDDAGVLDQNVKVSRFHRVNRVESKFEQVAAQDIKEKIADFALWNLYEPIIFHANYISHTNMLGM